jgi:hypothetical protein
MKPGVRVIKLSFFVTDDVANKALAIANNILNGK